MVHSILECSYIFASMYVIICDEETNSKICVKCSTVIVFLLQAAVTKMRSEGNCKSEYTGLDCSELSMICP